MTGMRPARCGSIACGLLLAAALLGLTLPVRAAPAPEETALNSPRFPETLSAGSFHTCGLRTDGTLACWGSNSSGQSTPPGGTYNQISAGDYHSCGLRTDGYWICWGSNDYGQLGGYRVTLPLAVRVP